MVFAPAGYVKQKTRLRESVSSGDGNAVGKAMSLSGAEWRVRVYVRPGQDQIHWHGGWGFIETIDID